MDIITKNAEIVYAVEKELGKHIGAVVNQSAVVRSRSGVMTVLGKTITPRNDLANPYALTVTFIGWRLDNIVLSRGDKYTIIPQAHIKSSVEAFARRQQENRDE